MIRPAWDQGDGEILGLLQTFISYGLSATRLLLVKKGSSPCYPECLYTFQPTWPSIPRAPTILCQLFFARAMSLTFSFDTSPSCKDCKFYAYFKNLTVAIPYKASHIGCSMCNYFTVFNGGIPPERLCKIQRQKERKHDYLSLHSLIWDWTLWSFQVGWKRSQWAVESREFPKVGTCVCMWSGVLGHRGCQVGRLWDSSHTLYPHPHTHCPVSMKKKWWFQRCLDIYNSRF